MPSDQYFIDSINRDMLANNREKMLYDMVVLLRANVATPEPDVEADDE